MKRTLSLALAAVMMMGLMAGCAKDEPAASTPAASTPAASTPAEPEGWKPTKDVEMVIPASAGGGSDLWARMDTVLGGLGLLHWVSLLIVMPCSCRIVAPKSRVGNGVTGSGFVLSLRLTWLEIYRRKPRPLEKRLWLCGSN